MSETTDRVTPYSDAHLLPQIAEALYGLPAALAVTRLRDGLILRVNRSFAQLFGYTLEDLARVDRRGELLYADPQDRERLLQSVRDTGDVPNQLLTMRAKDGGTRQVQVSLRLFTFEGEECLLAHCVDFTWRWRLEQQLRESEERYHQLFDKAGDAICFFAVEEADGNRLGPILECNTAMARLYGYSRRELLQMTVQDLVSDLTPARIRDVVKRLRAGLGSVDNFVGKTKDGRRLELENYSSSLMWRGQFCVLTYVRDVTGRREAERVLRWNEESLRVGLRDLGVTLFRQDRELRYTWLFDSQQGYLSAQVAGTAEGDWLKGEEAREGEKLKREVLQSGRPLRRVLSRTMGGETRLFEFVVEPLRDEQAEIVGVTGAAIDITERERVRTELQMARDLFERIAGTAPVGIFRADASGRLTYANDAAAAFSGRSREELLQLRLVDLVPLWDKESAELEWRRIAVEQKMYSGESSVALPDGSIRWGLVNIRPVSNGPGHLEFIGSVTDVTDRIHERQILRALVEVRDRGENFFPELLQRIAAQLELPYAYLLECDPASGKCGRMLALWNNGREIPPLADCHLPDACPVGPDCATASGCPRDVVAWLHTPPAQRTWARDARVRVAVPLIGESGRELGFLGVLAVQKLRDPDTIVRVLERAAVSLAADVEHMRAREEKRRMEAQLLQSQKMEALGALAGGIAHDFNNILTAVLNYTALAKLDGAANMSPEVAGYLEEVQRAGLRARDLVKQILAFSRPGERPVNQELRPVQLHRIAEEVLALVRPSASSSITIALASERDLPPVLAEPAQMQQVILNLCVNALQAMKRRLGTINLRIEGCYLPPEAAAALSLTEGHYVRLAVEDQGCGIDPALLERIFDPFYTTKSEEGGTGLGLAVVRGIVRRHAGAITVRSEPGQGTCFVVHLPAFAGPSAANGEGPACPINGRGQRIVLVDDEPAALRSLGLLLERQGFSVRCFANPEDALLAIWTAPDQVDLLITDLQMPLMTGLMLTERARTARPTLPVILMSGHLNEIPAAELTRLGFASVLAKPLLWAQLTAALQSVFGAER